MMKATTRAGRAIERAAQRGRARVSLPTEVLVELVAQAQTGVELRRDVERMAAHIGRQLMAMGQDWHRAEPIPAE